MASKLQTDIKAWLEPHCVSWTYIRDSGPKRGEEDTQHAIRINTSGLVNLKTAPAPAGWFDIDCILKNGHTVYIEVKDEGDRIRASQTAFHKALRESGVYCIVAHSLDDVISHFKAWGWI